MICKPKLDSHIDPGFQSCNPFSQECILKNSKGFWMQALISLGAPPSGRPGTWTSCSSWATWPRTTWPLSHSGVRAAASTNICTCRRPSSRCSSSSTSRARPHRAWSEWAKTQGWSGTGSALSALGSAWASFSYFYTDLGFFYWFALVLFISIQLFLM